MVGEVVMNLKSPTGSCPKETAASAALFGLALGSSLYARATLRLREGKPGLVYASSKDSCMPLMLRMDATLMDTADAEPVAAAAGKTKEYRSVNAPAGTDCTLL